MKPASNIAPTNQAKARIFPSAHRCENARGGGGGGFDVRGRMGRRQKSRLEGGGCEVDPFLEHTVKKLPEAPDIAGHHFVVAIDIVFGREEKSEHSANVIGGE